MFERVLIVDEDEALRESLEMILSAEGYTVSSAVDGASALEHADSAPIDAVLCDIHMPGIDGFDLLPQIARRLPGVPIVMTSLEGAGDVAVEAMRRGAHDYLTKPFKPSEVLFSLRKAKEREHLRRENHHLRIEMERAIGERPIVAASRVMIDLLELVERAAAYKTAALFTGERGSGKEILARVTHTQSSRRDQPFVSVACGAIPGALLESELFGHARGAFAGANRARRGFFAEADGGTIFLDEIAEIPTSLQAKLVRVLQDEEIRPVGENKSIAVDVRIIASTERDLSREVAEGRFREDLFYRLNVMTLEVPALRDRREDIPLLCDHFLAHYRETLGKNVRSISDEALDRLVAHSWPGNVRELENVIERAIILSDDDLLGLDHLPPAVIVSSNELNSDGTRSFSLKGARRRFEADFIRRALKETNGNRTHAARLLEISHRALLYKLKEYQIRD